MLFGFWGLGFRLGCRGLGLGFRARVQGLGFRFWGEKGCRDVGARAQDRLRELGVFMCRRKLSVEQLFVEHSARVGQPAEDGEITGLGFNWVLGLGFWV